MKILSALALCLILFSCNQNKCNCPVPVLGKGWAFLDVSKDTSEVDCKIYQRVRTYLKGTLKDDSSYQPVSFAEFFPVHEKGKLVGYTIKHKYRAKNGWGAYGLGCEQFRMDTAFNVLYAEETTYMDDDLKDIDRRYQEMKDKGEIK